MERDDATRDLIAALAQRREPAKLLLLGTYRPEEVTMSRHPLYSVEREPQVHGHCDELSLTFLSAAAVREYLTRRFPGLEHSGGLTHIVHQRTDGNPLFMVSVMADWDAQGLLVERQGQWTLQAGVEA